MTKAYWPSDLMQTRVCRTCHRDLGSDHYSMWSSREENILFGQYSSTPTCNECTVAGTLDKVIPSFFAAAAEWKQYAACDSPDVDENLFFPRSRKQLQEAHWGSVCDSCPVLAQCGEFGEQTRSEGVWGGKYLGRFEGVGENGPGAKLLLAGECRKGHSIDGMDDIILKKSAKGSMGYSGTCRKCALDRTRAWKKAVGHEQYAKEWARQKERLARSQEEKDESMREVKRTRAAAQRLKRKIPKLHEAIPGVELTSVDKLLAKGVCIHDHPINSADDLYVTSNPNSLGGVSARCRECQRKRVRDRRVTVQDA